MTKRLLPYLAMTALVGVVIYRLFNFWLPIVPALALMPAVARLRERFERAEQAS